MKTTILILLAAATLTGGCGWLDREKAAFTGAGTKTCVDGVLYLQFTSGATVAYTPDGKVKTCSM